MTARVSMLLCLVLGCGHEGPSKPPPTRAEVATAEEHLQNALAAEGIHQRGDTPVDTSSYDAFARSFVAVLAGGDQRAALALFRGELWASACPPDMVQDAAVTLGGLMVSIPRKIVFGAVTPVGDARTVTKGEKLLGCAVAADTTVRTVHVTWTSPSGEATLDIARAGSGDWTLTGIRQP